MKAERSDAPPLVSVGLPVYNGGHMLRRALDSLLAQDYPALEIILRDNASTDETETIGREYANRDLRVRYLRNPENVGVTKNFQLSLGDAQGRYFMWAAHDDLWSSDYVSRLVAALASQPGAVLSCGRAAFVNEQGANVGGMDSHAPRRDQVPWRTLLDEHATHWIYGVFARERLLELAPSLWRHRPWGGDMVWLLGLATGYPVTGDDAALLSKTQKPSPYVPHEARAILSWQFWYLRALLAQIARAQAPFFTKVRALASALLYWARYNTKVYGASSFPAIWAVALRDILLGREPTRSPTDPR